MGLKQSLFDERFTIRDVTGLDTESYARSIDAEIAKHGYSPSRRRICAYLAAAGVATTGAAIIGARVSGVLDKSPQAGFDCKVVESQPTATFGIKTPQRTVMYVRPHSGEEIVVYNTSSDSHKLPLNCSLYLDAKPEPVTTGIRVFGEGEELPITEIYRAKLSATEEGKPHKLKLEVKEKERIVDFQNRSSDPDAGLPEFVGWLFGMPSRLRYQWTVDGSRVSAEPDYSARLALGQHQIELFTSDGQKEDRFKNTIEVPESLPSSMERSIDVDPESLAQYTPQSLGGIHIKGINYHIGRQFMDDYGKTPDQDEINESLEVSRRDLGCNAIKLFGDNQDVMIYCAEKAIEKNIQTIILSYRQSFKAPKQEIAIDEHAQAVIELSKKAEQIRETHSDTILCVGEELQYTVRGLVDAPSYDERIEAYHNMSPEKRAIVDRNLNDWLSKIVKGVRENFFGQVTYSSNEMTTPVIKWGELGFDIIGPMFYSAPLSDLKKLKTYGKPVYVTEFGSQCFIGAGKGDAYHGQEYSQKEQAQYIKTTINSFKGIGIDGIFYWDLIMKIDETDAESFGLLKWNRAIPSTRKAGFHMYKSFMVG